MENENNVMNNEVDENIVINNEISNEVVNENKKIKKPIIIGIGVAILILVGVFIATYFLIFSPSAKYNKATELIDDGKYIDAKNILIDLETNEKTTEKLRLCNHMILYNHILENGTAYKDFYYIENPDTGVNVLVKKDDKTIVILYGCKVGESTIMDTISAFPIDSNNVDIFYFVEFDYLGETVYFSGEGTFYPHLYDGNLDSTEKEDPQSMWTVESESSGGSLTIDDIYYSPYIEIDIDDRGIGDTDELVALTYYANFPDMLETISNQIEYMNCGVKLSDFGIVLK